MTELAVRPDAFELVRDLEAAGALTPTGLSLPYGMPFERYETLGRFFGRLDQMSKWAVGDWVLYGEGEYGELMEATGLSRHTIETRRWVSSRIKASLRREAVSFSAHILVAKLDPPDQEQWLAMAERERMTVEQLREALKHSPSGNGASEQPQWTRPEQELARRVLDDTLGGERLLSAEMVAELRSAAG